MTRLAFALLSLGLAGCAGFGESAYDEAQVRAEVLAALRAFEAAERTLDPDAVIAFLDPEFSMFQDGHRADYATTVEQIRASLPSLRSFDARFEDIEIEVLGPGAAMTSMVFRDVITDRDGQVSRAWGPSTMLWRHSDVGWRIAFADSDHYAPK